MKYTGAWMRVDKVNPTSEYEIRTVYIKLLSSCKDLEHLSFHDFLSCRNDIFCLVDRIYGNITGILACRRSTMDELGIDKIDYHCQANDSVYKIEAFHCSDNVSDEDLANFLNTALVDKNDGFIYYKPSCPAIIYDSFKRQNIRFDRIDLDDGSYYYIKKPTVRQ